MIYVKIFTLLYSNLVRDMNRELDRKNVDFYPARATRGFIGHSDSSHHSQYSEQFGVNELDFFGQNIQDVNKMLCLVTKHFEISLNSLNQSVTVS